MAKYILLKQIGGYILICYHKLSVMSVYENIIVVFAVFVTTRLSSLNETLFFCIKVTGMTLGGQFHACWKDIKLFQKLGQEASSLQKKIERLNRNQKQIKRTLNWNYLRHLNDVKAIFSWWKMRHTISVKVSREFESHFMFIPLRQYI